MLKRLSSTITSLTKTSMMFAASAVLIAAGAIDARATTVTIGEAAVLSADDNSNAGLLIAQNAPLAQAATIQSLSFYVSQAAGKLRLGLYDSTGANGGPGAKKAETAEITAVVGWNTANVVTPVNLPAGTYWLAYSPSYNSLHFVKGQTAGVREVNVGFAYGEIPATFPTPTGGDSYHWSFYATLNTTGSVPNIAAVKVNDFLNSLGANTKFDQGADPAKTLPMIQYLGLRTLLTSR